MCSWYSVRVNFILLCSMPSGSWIARDKAQDRTGCLHWVSFTKETCLFAVIHQFRQVHSYHGLLDFVPNSIKLGRACSSDVCSVLRTKVEMTVYAFHMNRWASYRYLPLHVILPRGLCYNYDTHKRCVPGALSPPLCLGTRLQWQCTQGQVLWIIFLLAMLTSSFLLVVAMIKIYDKAYNTLAK